MTFVPCPKCHRHLRSTETACVFCGASLAIANRSVAGPVVLLGAAAAAFALAACDPKAEPPTAPIEPPSTNAPPSTSAPPSALPAPSETASATPAPSATTAPSSTTAATPTTPHPTPSADIRPAMRYGLAPRRP